ncbi:hypothetical protein ACIBO5_55815 [Nonomuraea angiospora]
MSLTKTGEVAGTPTYMAPEVFTGQRAGAPADVFAWGAITVFAATGEDPFRADNLGGVMHRVLSSHPDLSALPPRRPRTRRRGPGGPRRRHHRHPPKRLRPQALVRARPPQATGRARAAGSRCRVRPARRSPR